MAKDIGFLALGTRRQFLTLPPKTDPKLLDEVKTELALRDLTPISSTRTPRIVGFFETTLPVQAAKTAARWQLTAPVVGKWADQLRRETHTEYERTTLLKDFFAEIHMLLTDHGLDEPSPWSLLPDEKE